MNITEMNNIDLSPIVSKAIFFSEQINDSLKDNINLQKVNQNLINQRLENWIQAVGNEKNLKKRLDWDQLDFNLVCNLLGSVELKKDSFPFWGEILKEFLNSDISSLFDLKIQQKLPLDPNNPLAFEEFYLPFIKFSRTKLYTHFSKNLIQELLSEEAYYSLERQLLQQLVNLGTSTLLFEFEKFRKNNPSNSHKETITNKVLYNIFRETLLQDKGYSFFKQYPVFARLLATTLNFWVESTVEFLQRLQTDLSDLKLTFSQTNNLGKVKKIETSLSDPHNNGRFVLSLTFDSSITIIYKPKDLTLDVAFNNLQNWCNQQSLSLPLKSLTILKRREYGWVEFVKHQPCEEEKEVQNFYKRAGMLLSLMYVLGAQECQNVDVIAQGEYPVIIDADCLMSPVLKNFDNRESWFSDSVVKIGFLPSWEGDYMMTTNAQDFSVLGGIFPQQINASREWKFINTDKMQLVPKSVIIPAKYNVVIFNEETVYPHNYVENIVEGFEEIYSLFLTQKETLLSENSLLVEFQFAKSRLNLHPAVSYTILTKKSLNPQYLANGLDFSLLLEGSTRTYLTSEEKPDNWVILLAEIKALQQLDIPYLKVACNSDCLEIGPDQSVENFFKTSSYQKLRDKVQNLKEKDLDLQIKLIRLSFYAKRVHLTKTNLKDLGTYTQFSPLTCEELLQEALRIGDSLVENAIHSENGCNWIELEYMFRANRYQLKPLDDSLFLGRSGVSLFLAALAKITGKSEFQEVALAGISPIRQALTQGKLSFRILGGELGILGYGGIIYTLTKISQFLEDSTLLEDAQQTAKFITEKAIVKDHRLDIIFGVAGATLGLLALYQATGDQEILQKAIHCGDHLLSQRTDTFPKAWMTLLESKKPLTGFSHGAAGIILSLLRLYAVRENIAYLEAAKEGLEYERSVIKTSEKICSDSRLANKTNSNNVLLYAWCHGSTGIGLGRLGSLPILPREEMDSDIKAALATTQRYCQGINQDIDNLCCGTLGRTELFTVASQKLDNQEWLNDARKQAAWLMTRSRENQEYTFFGHLASSILNPNFFKGSAGAGYQLLRLASPESLPSVLIFE